MFHRQTATHT